MKRILIFVVASLLAITMSLPGDAPPISTPATPTDDSPAAIALAREKGVANAQRDIAAGRLRIVYPSETSNIFGRYGHFDTETGYPRYAIGACEAGKAFDAEVEAYNEVMRKWHAEHKKQ